MKAIRIQVSEPLYREFQERAKEDGRSVAELIRQAMKEYRQSHRRPSLRDFRPVRLGKVLRPFTRDDLMTEMLAEAGH